MKLFARLLCMVMALACLPTALATQLQFIGTGDYRISGSTIAIDFAQLKNIDTTRSGRIYLTVRANLADSPTAPGYTLAGGLLSNVLGEKYDTLGPGDSFTGITGTLNYTAPPAGTYYVYLIAFEYPDLSTMRASARGTSNPRTFSAPTTPGSSSTGTTTQSLDLVCSCSYSIDGSNVTLKATSIENTLGRATGTIKVKLWATATPHKGGAISGYELASHTLSVTLGNNLSLRDFNATTAFVAPPAGTYHLTMTVAEVRNGQDFVMDYNNFSGTKTFSGSTGSGGSGGGSGSNTGSDSGLDLLCDCSYETRGTSIDLRVNRVENNSGRRTGTLKLKLWATASRYQGGYINGYELAEYVLPGSLTDREYFYGVAQTLAYKQPPAGTWFVTLLLTENNGTDQVMDYTNFDKTITIAAGSGGGTTPTKRPLDLECQCGYAVAGSNITLTASKVTNNSTTTSGQLKLKLYATTAAYQGGTISGYKVAEYAFPGTLTGNTFFSNISRTVAYTPPAAGTYYYTLLLTETGSSGEKIVDYTAFPTPVTVSGGTTSGGSGTGNDPWPLDPWNGYYAKQLPDRTEHFYKITLAEAGSLTLETSGSLDTVGRLFSGSTLIATLDFGGSGNNFKSTLNLAAGTYVLQLYEYFGRTGFYAIQSQFARPATSVTSDTNTTGTPASGGESTSSGSAAASSTPQQRTSMFETTATRSNGTASAASFGIGASRDGGFTYTQSVTAGEKVLIRGQLKPEAAHIGRAGGASLYVLVYVSGNFFMLDATGRVTPWDGQVASLQPFQTAVALASEVPFNIINTALPGKGEYYFYVGYQVAGEPLVYSKSPVPLTAE